MNENTPPSTGDSTPAAPAPTETGPAKAKVEKAAPEKRYAVYDLSHGRFVGPVLGGKDAKKTAETDAKERGKKSTHTFEVREV